MSNSEDDKKVCPQCGRKTPHSKTSLGFGWQLLIGFVILVPLTATLGPLGGLGTVLIFWLVSLGCKGISKFKCTVCGSTYDLSKSNEFIRRHKAEGVAHPQKEIAALASRTFTVARGQDQIGEFSLDLIQSNLTRGVLLKSDWYFDSSSNDWKPLSELVKF